MNKNLFLTTGKSQSTHKQFSTDDQSWTMRLISSERFNASMAVEYLLSVQDKPYLSLLGKRLFDLPEHDIDFFLPQLIYLYVTKVDVASVTHAYIEKRKKKDAQFTALCIWLLNCYAKNDSFNITHQAAILRSCLCDDNAMMGANEDTLLSLNRLAETNWVMSELSCRLFMTVYNLANSYHATSTIGNSSKTKTHDESSETGQENAKVLLHCQRRFVGRLIHVGNKLTETYLSCSKEDKTKSLHLELHMLNSMLPNSVWIPFDFENRVLNICVDESAVLNSKDKVPYIFFAEVLRVRSYRFKIPEIEYNSDYNNMKNNDSSPTKHKLIHDNTDPSVAVLSESWSEKKTRIRELSRFKDDPRWDLVPVIVKTGDDLSQESFAQQLLFTFKDIWHEEGVPLYLRPYKIVCVGPDAGLVEPVLDTLSLHQIKRQLTTIFRKTGSSSTPTLKHHFENAFGSASSESYINAQKNFIQSAAAYSLVSYFLQLKDRHNGNILLDMEGHLIHIDYGFLLSSSPRNLGFETAPFKLTAEIIEVMGGIESDMFLYYKSLLLRGFMAARKHHRRIVSLAAIMSTGSKMQCFRAGTDTVRALENRFHVSSTDEQLQQLVDTLVEGSRDSYTTRFYDSYQYYTNGIH